MKFTTIAVYATGALAAKPIFMEPTLVKRQSISQVSSDVSAISASAAALDTAIKGFSGASDSAALISASQAIVTAIKKATTDSSGFPDNSIDINTALPIAGPITSLGTEVTSTISDLTAKKAQFASLNLCGEVLQQIQAQQSAAMAFSTTLIGKLDASAKSTGQTLSAPILSALSSAASAFSSCPAGSSAASSSSAASTSSATGAVTSSSAAVTTTTPVTSVGSLVSTSTGTGVGSVPTNGTVPTSPSTPTITPNANAGVQKAAGFGGVVAAAFLALAAF